MSSSDDQALGVLLAFMQLSDVGPARGRQVAASADPERTWDAIVRGEPVIRGANRALERRWRDEASNLEPAMELRRHLDAGVSVAMLGRDRYPTAFASDRNPPPLVVWRGEWPSAGASCGVVGTRRCTRYGRTVARSLGHDLAQAGIHVVSGLALGIDGEAHAGALSAAGVPPVGVVACGLDVPYPRRHGQLWAEVARSGLLLSEWPLGVTPLPWRFPSRNRLIAALSDVLVVVESGVAGGSMHTVRDADDRGRTVLAVPGPVTSESSRGTNLLLSEGCAPCRDADDVLVALGLAGRSSRIPGDGPPAVAHAEITQRSRVVLEALGAERCTLDDLALATPLNLGELSLELLELEACGAVVCGDGWYEVAR